MTIFFESGVQQEPYPTAQQELGTWAQHRGTEALVPFLGDMVVGPLDHVGMTHWGFLIRVSKPT